MLRILTYNVHRWLGTDRKTDPGRTAAVIAACEADVVALQEVRLGTRRWGEPDQAEAVARVLGMDMHFQPTVRIMGEQFGLAILTGLSAKRVKGGPLPMLTRKAVPEVRSALWVSVEAGGEKLQVVNTHLSLLSDRERLAQADALIGEDWLGAAEGRGPAVLVGDLNAGPRSKAYKHLASRMRDVQLCAPVPCNLNTFHTRLPIRRIDHVFVSEGIRVANVEAIRTPLARVASDHVPLVADLRLGVPAPAKTRPALTIQAAA
jgi:endonuclease/exonuclease/phosphatase family metal-dependent hydrolase